MNLTYLSKNDGNWANLFVTTCPGCIRWAWSS